MNGSALRVAFALAGGLLFVFSLFYGVYAYLGPFGAVAGPWSFAAAAGPILTDVLLFTIFAGHHSLFARAGLKSRISSAVTPALERSVYVWIASALFILMCWAWAPVPGVAWTLAPPWNAAGAALQLGGLLLTAHASQQLGVLDLAGIRQVHDASPRPFTLLQSGGYRIVRHPIYLGWVLMVWPASTMTGTRLVFAAVSTLYLALAVPFEERSIRNTIPEYAAYARRVKWRIVPFLY